MITAGAYPCKVCSERSLGCHSTCERYMAVVDKHRKIAEEHYAKGDIDYIDFKTKTIRATKRRKG